MGDSVSTNVEPKEAAAIRELLDEDAAERADVVDRDFRNPRRLSSGALADVTRVMAAALGDMETRVAAAANTRWPIELGDVRETSANGLFEDQDGPFAALRFDCGGQIGWIVWESAAAVAGVEAILGGSSADATARPLSTVERAVLQSILAPVADATLRALGVDAGRVVVAQTREALGEWLDAGDAADPYRIHVALTIDGPGSKSNIDVYLPSAPVDASAVAQKSGPVDLPGHLDRVQIALAVRIEGCDVSLAQLLDIDVGDVIPLDARVGDHASLCVDERTIGHGQFGTHQGNLAIRIEHLEQESED